MAITELHKILHKCMAKMPTTTITLNQSLDSFLLRTNKTKRTWRESANWLSTTMNLLSRHVWQKKEKWSLSSLREVMALCFLLMLLITMEIKCLFLSSIKKLRNSSATFKSVRFTSSRTVSSSQTQIDYTTRVKSRSRSAKKQKSKQFKMTVAFLRCTWIVSLSEMCRI